MSGVRRWLPLGAILALLGAAMFATLYANPVLDQHPFLVVPPGGGEPVARETIPRLTATVTPGAASRPQAAPLPEWITLLATVACAAAVVAVLVWLAWFSLRDRRILRRAAMLAPPGSPPSLAKVQQEVQDAIDAGLADLDDDGTDPRWAVIACWARLERAAEVAGTRREPSDTSTDLVARLLASHVVAGAEVLSGLATAYREARFATHPVTAATRDRARAALRRLRDELARGSVRQPRPVVGAPQ